VVAEGSFGNRFLLPAGPLREPLWRLKTVDRVVTIQLEGDTVHRMTDSRERQPLKALAGRKVHAVAGIGDPERFFQHLTKAGVKGRTASVSGPSSVHAARSRIRRRRAGAAHREGRGKIAQRSASELVGSAGGGEARAGVRRLAAREAG
jgi:hypothetical protein